MAGSTRRFIKKMRYWANLENPGVGYSQDGNIRFDLRNGGSVDCSSFVIACLKIAGFETGSALNTSTMRAELTKHGWVVKPNNGDPQPGDILLNDGHHTAAYLGNGLLAEASIDERGEITGGRPGDQTGNETHVRNYYNFPWSCYLRYEGEQPAPHHHHHHHAHEEHHEASGSHLHEGSTGAEVRGLQEGLNRVFPSYSHLVVDGDFGPKTKAVVEEFQTRAGLDVNGVVDRATKASLKSYGVTF